MFQFAHTADLHLGAPNAPASAPPSVAAALKDAPFDALREILAYSTTNSLDALLIAGDLFHYVNPDHDITARAITLFGQFPGVRVYICPGNHDPYPGCAAWLDRRWPMNVHIFSQHLFHPARVPGHDVVIWASAWNNQQSTDQPLNGFRIPPTHHNTSNIILAHGSELTCQPPEWRHYEPFHAHSIDPTAVSYIALGHLHHWTQPPAPIGRRCLYPGSPCPTHPHEAKRSAFAHVTLDGDECHIRAVPTNCKQLMETTINIDPTMPPQTIKNLLKPANYADARNTIASVSFVGMPNKDTAAALPSIVETIRPAFFHLAVQDYTIAAPRAPQDFHTNPTFQRFCTALDELIAETPQGKEQDIMLAARRHAWAHYSGQDLAPRAL